MYDENSIRFTYQEPPKSHPSCVTYLAKMVAVEPINIVVKLVSKYGHNVRSAMAAAEFNPKLLYYGSINITSHMLLYGMLQMVVIEYVIEVGLFSEDKVYPSYSYAACYKILSRAANCDNITSSPGSVFHESLSFDEEISNSQHTDPVDDSILNDEMGCYADANYADEDYAAGAQNNCSDNNYMMTSMLKKKKYSMVTNGKSHLGNFNDFINTLILSLEPLSIQEWYHFSQTAPVIEGTFMHLQDGRHKPYLSHPTASLPVMLSLQCLQVLK
ncbi:hypothetical protein EV424DRAFT_1347025 [Suillus variegatus]|nr:hypothetical protein EV424DRAFT_1347025 [Suillus variegatus]